MTITFLVVSYILLIAFILFMPKKITIQEMYITFIVVALHTLVADTLFAGIFKLYVVMGEPGPQLIDLFTELTLPALFGIIYINFIPNGLKKKLGYIIIWVVLSVLYEILSRYVGYITFKGWENWLSVLFYLYACTFMIFHQSFIRKLKRDRRHH
ncbi:hypothetical protein [Metabacillus malikii]|uniref:Uncharacterized protein n=1 Tax=Metabacillus malikii TaxID=1504265 RepID=A0ABT9ZGV6_9BACI|nr:hypothetical protein [Metabacillus malikii]MDQ0231479.1 hypothetical protein [Metabacillus malikii]